MESRASKGRIATLVITGQWSLGPEREEGSQMRGGGCVSPTNNAANNRTFPSEEKEKKRKEKQFILGPITK